MILGSTKRLTKPHSLHRNYDWFFDRPVVMPAFCASLWIEIYDNSGLTRDLEGDCKIKSKGGFPCTPLLRDN